MRYSIKRIKRLDDQLHKVERSLSRLRLESFFNLTDHPWRIIKLNLLAGIARGVGLAIGFSLLGAVVIIILQQLATQNVPIIGEFIARVVKIVEAQLSSGVR